MNSFKVCLKLEIKQVWWGYFLSLSIGKKKKEILSRHPAKTEHLNHLFHELISMCMSIWSCMACVSKLKVLLTLYLENDSSKGKVLQNIASFLKVMGKKS